jgi:hypothetical protein
LSLPEEVRNANIKPRIQVPASIPSGRWKKDANGEWGFDTSDNEDVKKEEDDSNSDCDEKADQKTIHYERVSAFSPFNLSLIISNFIFSK